MLVSLSRAQATGAGIWDAAGVFSQDAIATAEQQIAAIHKRFGKDLRVETYASIPADRADQYVPEQRTGVFRHLGLPACQGGRSGGRHRLDV
jgi:hypothetical protein